MGGKVYDDYERSLKPRISTRRVTSNYPHDHLIRVDGQGRLCCGYGGGTAGPHPVTDNILLLGARYTGQHNPSEYMQEGLACTECGAFYMHVQGRWDFRFYCGGRGFDRNNLTWL